MMTFTAVSEGQSIPPKKAGGQRVKLSADNLNNTQPGLDKSIEENSFTPHLQLLKNCLHINAKTDLCIAKKCKKMV